MPKNDMDKSKDNLEIEKKDICSETKLGTIHSKLDSWWIHLISWIKINDHDTNVRLPPSGVWTPIHPLWPHCHRVMATMQLIMNNLQVQNHLVANSSLTLYPPFEPLPWRHQEAPNSFYGVKFLYTFQLILHKGECEFSTYHKHSSKPPIFSPVPLDFGQGPLCTTRTTLTPPLSSITGKGLKITSYSLWVIITRENTLRTHHTSSKENIRPRVSINHQMLRNWFLTDWMKNISNEHVLLWGSHTVYQIQPHPIKQRRLLLAISDPQALFIDLVYHKDKYQQHPEHPHSL